MITTKTDFAKIRLIEIGDELKKRNRDFAEGRTPSTGYRIVVSFSDAELSDKERELLARIKNEQQRQQMERQILSNRTEIRYSGVFNAEDILSMKDGSPFVTPKDGYTDEQQEEICKKIIEAYESCGNTNIFTVVTVTVDELLKDTEFDGTAYLLYENANGVTTKIDSQSRLFFGVFDDVESAKVMIRRSLLNRIENGDLEVPDNKAENTTENTEKVNPLLNL